MDRRDTVSFPPSGVTWLIGVLFVTAALHGVVALGQGWDHPVLDMHGFRQSQTAISTEYLLRGSDWLAYETPVLGPAWSIPMELPLYQWVVALWVWLTGMSLEPAGRLVSAAGFVVSVALVYVGLGHWSMPWPQRLAFLSPLLASPIYLFWSRTFMIESVALALSLGYLVAVARLLRTRRALDLVVVCALGCLAAAAKITTFFAFGLAAALLLVGTLLDRPAGLAGLVARGRQQLGVSMGLLVGGAIAPLAAAVSWTRYADSVKAQVPLAEFLSSSALTGWNFGTAAQRTSSELWRSTVWERIGPDALGSEPGVLVGLGVVGLALLVGGRYCLATLAGIVLFLAPLLTFTKLHIVHHYYPYANVIFLLGSVGFALAGLLDSKRPVLVWIGAGACVLISVTAAYGYNQGLRRVARQAVSPEPIVEVIPRHVSSDGVILVYGRDWSPTIPYYSGRRAIMDRRFRDVDHVAIRQALAMLGDRQLEGVVSCGLRERDPRGLEDRLRKLGFPTVPTERADRCELYARKAPEEASPACPPGPCVCSRLASASP